MLFDAICNFNVSLCFRRQCVRKTFAKQAENFTGQATNVSIKQPM